MQGLPFPKSVCYKIDRVVRKFLWGDGDTTNKVHLISWNKICVSKKNGGLGINKSYERNLAFLAKLYWRVLNEQSPWTFVCKHRLSLKSCGETIIDKALLLGK